MNTNKPNKLLLLLLRLPHPGSPLESGVSHIGPSNAWVRGPRPDHPVMEMFLIKLSLWSLYSIR